MRKFFRPFAIAVVCLGIGCKRSGGFEVPAEVGRGLSEVDSLGALLQWLEGQRGYAADTLRLHVVFELIKAIGLQNPDSAYRLAQYLEALSQKSAYSAAKALNHLGWSSAYFYRAMYDSIIYRASRALEVLGEPGHDRLRAQAFHNLGFGYQNKGEYDSALTYYQKAISIRVLIGDMAGLAASYNNIGSVHSILGHLTEALQYFQKAAQSWENSGNKARVAASYNNIGVIYYTQGKYKEALEYHQKALRIREAFGDKRGLADSYTNIGIIYYAQERYAEALEYHQKAQQIWEAFGDRAGLGYSYNSIGSIYRLQGRYAESLEYHQKARQIREAIGDKMGLAESYHNIGNLCAAQGRYAEALEYHRKACEIREAIGDQNGLTFSYANIGDLYRARGQPHLGRTYLLKALAITQELKANDRLQEIYGLLSRTDSVLAASGEPAYWKTAYEYARLHGIYRDSVVNKESIRRQAQLESQYEYEKKVALLKAQQEKERALNEAEKRRRESERNLSLVIAGVAVSGAGILLYFLGVIRRQKRALEVAKEGLEVANRELEVANGELRAMNQALEASNRVIQVQAKELSEKNEEILDSLRYAEQIQRAILPSAEKWRRLLPDSFLVYLPRDIVAGDFYWLEETERYVFLGVADATGHGVPGAFVSLVCANALNKAVREEGLESPAGILTRAKALVSELLTREGGKLPDGMDIALVRFDQVHPWRLTYAGANRPLWIVSQTKEVIELSPTRQPVGYTEIERPFEEVAVDLAPHRPATVYGFTDGIVDQIGGPKRRKLMSKGLKELLLGIADLPCEVQRERIEAFFTEWRGEMRQMDDVTLVGVRVG